MKQYLEIANFIVLSLDLNTCYYAFTFISGEALSAKYISVYLCSQVVFLSLHFQSLQLSAVIQ